MIRLIKPYITFNDVFEEYKDIFESGWFTKGKYVEKFKREIEKYIGCRYAFLTTSATTALSLSLKVLNIQPGDEVVVSDFSFPATANVVEDIGAVPIFADVSTETFNMLPHHLESGITEKTKAVIFVDAFGNPSGIHEIKNICSKYHIPLIEDAACAIGSSEDGNKCGNIADLTCFSFHPRKLLTTGEGGAITTNSDEYARILEIKLNHGAVIDDGKLDFIAYGYNYRMSELQAVMGLRQIEKLDRIITSRNEIKNEYVNGLLDNGFKPQMLNKETHHNVQSLVFLVPEMVSRDKLIHYLKDNKVETTIGTYCLSGTTVYKNKYNNTQANAKYLEADSITFPCYDGVDITYILNRVKKFL